MEKILQATNKLSEYIRSEDYKGYDPYDTLLSPVFSWPILRTRIIRFAGQQIGKRIPFSLRRLLAVPKGLNPVTLGLSIQAYSYLTEILPGSKDHFLQEIDVLIDLLIEEQSRGYSGTCWGYNFDWEARYTSIKAYVPTSVATADITNGLMECYKLTGNLKALNLTRDATNFILKDLNKSYEGELFCYSYSPVDNQFVLNASMKAAKLLSQIYAIDGDVTLKQEAAKAVDYVVDSQREDGSWAYARYDHRSWADNYHTGYILDSLDSYMTNTGDYSYSDNLERALSYYVGNFFTKEGAPKFYNNKIYPIDSTSAAQSLLSLTRFGCMELAEKVANWTIANMQHSNGGYYFRKHKWYTDRNIFMRWSNAWMFTGLTYFLYKMKRQ